MPASRRSAAPLRRVAGIPGTPHHASCGHAENVGSASPPCTRHPGNFQGMTGIQNARNFVGRGIHGQGLLLEL